jgi:hypothetical protein
MNRHRISTKKERQAKAWKTIVTHCWKRNLDAIKTQIVLAQFGITCDLVLIEDMFAAMQSTGSPTTTTH